MTTDDTTTSIKRISAAEAGRMHLDDWKNGRLHQNRIDTGIQALNRTLGGGWLKGSYNSIAARTSMGKTAVATSLCNRAFVRGANVMFISLEMGARNLMPRILSDLTLYGDVQVPCSVISGENVDGEFTTEPRKPTFSECEAIELANNRLDRKGYLFDFEKTGRTASSIRRSIEEGRAELGGKLDIVFIDHLSQMKREPTKGGNKPDEIAELSLQLQRMAEKLDVCIVLLCQLNRGPEGRDNKRATASDVKGSGDIEEQLDTLILPYREAYYTRLDPSLTGTERINAQADIEAKKYVIELDIRKNRVGGRTESFNLWCNLEYMAIRQEGYIMGKGWFNDKTGKWEK